MRNSRARKGAGFTLLEMVITITVIAILAGVLTPVIIGQRERAQVAAERHSLSELAKVFRRFHADTGYWPLNNTFWDPANGLDIDPELFTSSDTALFTMPTSGPTPSAAWGPCSLAQADAPCWGGPYLGGGGSMVAPGVLDVWGRPRMFAMLCPYAGYSGGTPMAPGGAVILWSRGPNGVDDTGCRDTSCTRDLDRLATGQAAGDDIIVVVGAAQ